MKKWTNNRQLVNTYLNKFHVFDLPNSNTHNFWHYVKGPLFTLITIIVTELFSEHIAYIPNTSTVYLTVVAYSSFTGGLWVGFISVVLSLAASIFFLSEPGQLFVLQDINIRRIIVLGFSAPLISLMSGVLKERTRMLAQEQLARAQAESKAQMIGQLQAITDTALEHLSLEQLLKNLLERIRDLLQAESAAIFLKDKTGKTLAPYATLGKNGETDSILTNTGVETQILVSKKPFLENSSKDHEQSLLGVPLLMSQEVIGVLQVTGRQRIFVKEDVQLMQLVGDRVSLAIDRAMQYQKAQEAITARDEFLSISSHELKTPLTSMLLQLQGVLRSIREESLANFSVKKMITLLESAERQSKRLAKMINDLLNVSLISTGRLDLDVEAVDLKTIVDDVCQRFEEQSKNAGCTLTVQTPTSIIVTMDKYRIEQVITNLISNALKYGKGKPIKVELTKDEKTARLVVADQGIGIPEAQITRIFNRFERAVSARDFKGLGIGLYIVKQIVEAHNGTISVQSTLGQGSAFIVELPV